MQAIRQCTVCASPAGGLLRNQTDISLLRTNKIVFRREAAAVRLLSSSENVQRRNRNYERIRVAADAHMSIASLSSIGRELCSFPFTQQVENLTHDSLIRRAASVVTDSSSTFLSQTTLALVDALTEYSKAVHTRIIVQRRYIASFGKLAPAEENMLLEMINGQRAEVSSRLDECKRFESTWVNAVNLCKMAAEAAHTSGAEQASITVRTNIQVAQSQVEEARKLSLDADKMLAETKVEEIQRMAEYAAFCEDEFELHEAYLRED